MTDGEDAVVWLVAAERLPAAFSIAEGVAMMQRAEAPGDEGPDGTGTEGVKP